MDAHTICVRVCVCIYIYTFIYIVRYFYQDEIVKYDGSLTPQIERTINKETILLTKI